MFVNLGLDSTNLTRGSSLTGLGQILISYFQYRADCLNNHVKLFLMDKKKAKKMFKRLKKRLEPTCPLPMNKQKGDKKDYMYFTGIVNMLIESNAAGIECDYSPKELTAFTKNGFPARSMSRRIDGAFPNVVNPIAIWEIKEYYNTTTFGSRVADGVYETQLDGYEVAEVVRSLGISVKHYLMIDDYFTWWVKGRSYLCRVCDLLHMGFVTEVIFGAEVLKRIPELVNDWKKELQGRNR